MPDLATIRCTCPSDHGPPRGAVTQGIQLLDNRPPAQALGQPHYRFGGFVFAEPKYQAANFSWIRGDDAESAITKEGALTAVGFREHLQ